MASNESQGKRSFFMQPRFVMPVLAASLLVGGAFLYMNNDADFLLKDGVNAAKSNDLVKAQADLSRVIEKESDRVQDLEAKLDKDVKAGNDDKPAIINDAHYDRDRKSVV